MPDADPNSQSASARVPGEETLPLDALSAACIDAMLDAILAIGVFPELIVDGDGGPPAPLEFADTVREMVGHILRRAREGVDPESDRALMAGRAALSGSIAAAAAATAQGISWTTVPAFTAGSARYSMSRTFCYEAAEEWCARSWPLKEGPHGWSLHWYPQSEEAAQLDLLELVHRLARKQAHHSTVPLTAIELRASVWWFRRFTPPNEDSQAARKRRVRELEWTLTVRKEWSSDDTMLCTATLGGFYDTLRPRAARMARWALQPRPGVFVVRDRSGLDATLEDMLTHERVPLLEAEYVEAWPPGTVFAGTLYPIVGRYIRSPGALIFGPWSDTRAEEFAAAVRVLREINNDTLSAIEWAVTAGIVDRDTEYPTPSPAAKSQAEARALLNALREGMEGIAMLEGPIAEGALWLGQSPVSENHFTIFGWPADNAMVMWVSSLLEIAGISHEEGTSTGW